MDTLAAALRQLQSRGLPRLEAQMLLLHALGQPAHARAWLLAHDADPLPPDAAARA
ncbi:MAG: peptide chain release factor N(5)-glutamine methyltransferase, partial [Ottowia sp.]